MKLFGIEIDFSSPQQMEPSDEDIGNMNRFEELLDDAEQGEQVDKQEFLQINRSLHMNGWEYRHGEWQGR